jgi:hypothetical protein
MQLETSLKRNSLPSTTSRKATTVVMMVNDRRTPREMKMTMVRMMRMMMRARSNWRTSSTTTVMKR